MRGGRSWFVSSLILELAVKTFFCLRDSAFAPRCSNIYATEKFYDLRVDGFDFYGSEGLDWTRRISVRWRFSL